MAWTTLCDLTELAEGKGHPVEVDGYRLAVFLHGNKPYVLSDECPHAGAPLHNGWIDDDCVICPVHCWRFTLTDGRLPGGGEGVWTYPTRVHTFDGREIVQADLKMP